MSGDTLRVVDVGNGKLEVLGLEGAFIRSTPLPAGASVGPVDVDDEGRILMATGGLQEALASYHDVNGNQLRTLGTPRAPVSTLLDIASMKKEMLAGGVPAIFRNMVLPVFAHDGGFWLILNGEGLVERYDSAGSLQVSAPLVAPEMEAIRADLVERTRATMSNPRRLPGFAYVADAAAVGETLWVLLNVPEAEPAVMLALGADGAVQRRLIFADVRGARFFAVDRARDRVLFVITSNAGVVAAPWPKEAL